jgi:hypothetical protein
MSEAHFRTLARRTPNEKFTGVLVRERFDSISPSQGRRTVRRRFVIFLSAAFVSIVGAASCQEIEVDPPGDEKEPVDQQQDQPQKQDQPQQKQDQPQQQQEQPQQQGEQQEEQQEEKKDAEAKVEVDTK